MLVNVYSLCQMIKSGVNCALSNKASCRRLEERVAGLNDILLEAFPSQSGNPVCSILFCFIIFLNLMTNFFNI